MSFASLSTFRSVGDLSQLYATRGDNVSLKTRLGRLTNELSSGKVSDVAAHLGRDTFRLADLDRTLALGDAHRKSALAAGGMLETMQKALSGFEDLQSSLANQTAAIPMGGSTADLRNAGTAAREAMTQIVQVLNTGFGGVSLFAGRATDGPAMADAETIMASLRAATSAATDAASLTAAVDAWFDIPNGGFETVAYLGDTGGTMTRPIDEGQIVAVEARADDPAFRELMKGVALAALAGDPASPLNFNDRKAAMGAASGRLLNSPTGILGVQTRLGLAENRVEDAVVRHGARATSLGILRNDMVGADPFTTASQLQEVETLLQTHYLVTARLSQLSLAKVMR